MYKKILILAAMDSEVEVLLNSISHQKIGDLTEIYPTYQANINQKDVVICQTHVGMNHANLATSLAISHYAPDLVIKFGCVGGSTKSIHQGDLILPLGYFHNSAWITKSNDLIPTTDSSKWINLYGDQPFQVTLKNLANIPAVIEQSRKVRQLLLSFLDKNYIEYKSSYVGTGDIWYFEKPILDHVQKTFLGANKSWVADMESYPVAFASKSLKKDFIGIYAVSSSDYYNEEYNPKLVSDLLRKKLGKVLLNFIKGF